MVPASSVHVHQDIRLVQMANIVSKMNALVQKPNVNPVFSIHVIRGHGIRALHVQLQLRMQPVHVPVQRPAEVLHVIPVILAMAHDVVQRQEGQLL